LEQVCFYSFLITHILPDFDTTLVNKTYIIAD
jgi:hypothetical protein